MSNEIAHKRLNILGCVDVNILLTKPKLNQTFVEGITSEFDVKLNKTTRHSTSFQ